MMERPLFLFLSRSAVSSSCGSLFLPPHRGGGLRCLVPLLFLTAALAAGCNHPSPPPETTATAPPKADVSPAVHRFCGDCHAYPPAEIFPRRYWKDEVERGYTFASQSGRIMASPDID